MAKKKKAVMLQECPNCSSIWAPGSEEWMFQECDACGWPNPYDQDYNDEKENDGSDEYDDEDDSTHYDTTHF